VAITQLTAAGNAEAVKLISGKGATVKVTVAAIDTNAVVKLEYSNAADFGSGVVQGQTLTITANGDYLLNILPGHSYARLVFVSETGGTAATIDATYYLQEIAAVRYDYCNSSAFSSGVVKGETVFIPANGTYIIPVLPGYGFTRPVVIDEAGSTAGTYDFVTEIHE
jgi:hypothetical protein